MLGRHINASSGLLNGKGTPYVWRAFSGAPEGWSCSLRFQWFIRAR